MSSLTGKSLNPVMNRRSVIASAAGLGAMSILAGCSSNGGDSGSASGDASFKIGTIGPLTGVLRQVRYPGCRAWLQGFLDQGAAACQQGRG